MKDIYLYEDCPVLVNKPGIKNQQELEDAEADYVRTALVAYNAVFEDLGDLSKREYLEQIVFDAIASS